MRPPTSSAPALTGAALLLVAAAAGAGSALPAPRVAAVTVDGDTAEWAGVPVRYLESGPRVTGIAHDSTYLYVYFRYSDLELARRVLHTGAIVWVNPAGKHKADFGVRYRGTDEARKALESMESSAQAWPDGAPPPGGAPRDGSHSGEGGGRSPKHEPAALGALEVIHYGVADDVIADGAKPDGAAAACRVVDGAFTYELRIPLAEAAEGDAAAAARRTIAVGFQMGGMTPAELDAMREHMGRGGPGGGAGGFGGGFGGSHGGVPGGGMPGGGGAPGGGEGGVPGGPPEGGERARHGTRNAEPVWLDVELVDAPPATAAPRAK